MVLDDFDITFCSGEVHFTQNNVEATLICPKRENCHRWWSPEKAEKAIKTGHIYNSFFLMDDPNFITDEGCENFWREK